MRTESARGAIEAVVAEYLEGMIHGQRDRLERAMHPRCMQAGRFGRSDESFDREAFVRLIDGETASPPGKPYLSQTFSTDMTGDVAVVKVEDECFGTTFTDHLTFTKYEHRWQIVMKAFLDHANA